MNDIAEYIFTYIFYCCILALFFLGMLYPLKSFTIPHILLLCSIFIQRLISFQHKIQDNFRYRWGIWQKAWNRRYTTQEKVWSIQHMRKFWGFYPSKQNIILIWEINGGVGILQLDQEEEKEHQRTRTVCRKKSFENPGFTHSSR